MSEPINDGGPAFPLAPERWTDIEGVQHMTQEPGMSLRDWFAGQALVGIMSGNREISGNGEVFGFTRENVAAAAYVMADAMLAARDGAK